MRYRPRNSSRHVASSSSASTGRPRLRPAKAVCWMITLGLCVAALYFSANLRESLLNMNASRSDNSDETVAGKEQAPSSPHFLEELMFKFGSDKSHDDHGYTDMYQMIFNPIRHDVGHFMEVGIAAGQSIQAMYHYFPKATIHAFDVSTTESVKRIVDQLADRVIYHEKDLLASDLIGDEENADNVWTPYQLDYGMIDVLIEDAMHTPQQQQLFLERLFPLVKPGGYYIVEDIAMSRKPGRIFQESPETLRPKVREILESNDVIFVDTAVGHRAWASWKEKSGQVVKNHVEHNSYLLVLRKRVQPLPKEIIQHVGVTAMKPDKVLLDSTSTAI